MDEFVSEYPRVASLIIYGLITVLLSFLTYYLKQNLDVLKDLTKVVSSLKLSFAIHEAESEAVASSLLKMENRLEVIEGDVNKAEKSIFEIQSDLNSLKRFKDES